MKKHAITTSKPNFRVGPTGIDLKFESAKGPAGVLRFLPQDGIRVVAKENMPYVEFSTGGKVYAAKLKTEAALKRLCSMLRHESQFRTESLDFYEAFTRSSIPTVKLARAFAESTKGGKAGAGVVIERKVRKMPFAEKVGIISKTAMYEGASVLTVGGVKPLLENEGGMEEVPEGEEETSDAMTETDDMDIPEGLTSEGDEHGEPEGDEPMGEDHAEPEGDEPPMTETELPDGTMSTEGEEPEGDEEPVTEADHTEPEGDEPMGEGEEPEGDEPPMLGEETGDDGEEPEGDE